MTTTTQDLYQGSIIETLWCYFRNLLADMIRRVMCSGPERKMYKELARKLVDEGEWFMIPLFSGMQTPILSAIKYLAKTNDIDSVPRLKRLFLDTHKYKQRK